MSRYSGQPLKFTVRVDDDEVLEQLRASRSDLNARLKDTLRTVAEDVALPHARRTAPRKTGLYRSHLAVTATATTAFLGVRRKDVPYAGILNFGGTRRDPIMPRRERAAMRARNKVKIGRVKSSLNTGTRVLKLPWGYRSRVDAFRVYPPSWHLVNVIAAKRGDFRDRAAVEVQRVLERHVEVTR